MGHRETESALPDASTAGGEHQTAGRRTMSGVLALACAAQFMVVLDVSVVNVALPSIQKALKFDPAALQWVVNAYALVFAGFLLLGAGSPISTDVSASSCWASSCSPRPAWPVALQTHLAC
ncbi:hypothetical protein Srufu_068630 [Streptomyces libani subsp. rufus]|nr:hypothetical protein Srufu_068630 [Streptomyces libani subsp. rufus]